MEKKQQDIIVEGFLFHDKNLADKARKEREGIKYIREKTDLENPHVVLQIYHKIIAQKLFETPVGLGYLKELREYLLAVPAIKNEEIEPIPLEDMMRENYLMLEGKQNLHLPQRLKLSVGINVVLLLLVAGMFAVTLTGSHPNIINYEKKIVDKYAGWEEELRDREEALRVRERE